MIKAIRKRARPDNLKNQVRAGGQSFARKLYFYCIVGLFVSLGWTFTGHWFFLDAEGIVTKERTIIAPDYAARVLSIHVKSGDVVKPGTVIATLQSREVLDSIAEFTTRRAQLTTRESQIIARMVTIRDVMPIAEERLKRARELLSKLDTIQSSDQTADLSQRRSQALARQGQLTSLLQTIQQTTVSAEKRLEQAKVGMQRMDELFKKQLTTAPRVAEVQKEFYDAERQVAGQRNETAAYIAEAKTLELTLKELDTALAQSRMLASAPRQAEGQRETYDAQRELTTLRTENAALNEELANLQKTREEVDAAIEQVKTTYNGGKVVSQIEGVVGPKVPHLGQIVKSGEPLVELYRGDMFVLAYMPIGHLYSIVPNDAVRVSDGQRVFAGRIERIENVTDALPPEFQVNFRSMDRQQLFRVVFDGQPPFAIQSKIKLSSNWSPQGLMSLGKGAVLAAGGTVSGWLRFGSTQTAAQ
jgi:multidrug resistance efflux pump